MAGGFRRFLDAAREASGGSVAPVTGPGAYWQDVARSIDPMALFWRSSMMNPTTDGASMLLGSSDGLPRKSEPQTSTLVLAPPRSSKTSGFLIPAIFCHRGPVLSVSSKFDVARNTAMAQARKGTCWHFSVDGSPTPEGFRELRWSPITGASDWSTAVRVADAMVEASGAAQAGGENSFFFNARAGTLLAAVCHYAALFDRDMEYVVDVILNYDVKGELEPMMEELRGERGSERAVRGLRGILISEDRTRSAIAATAAVVLKVYELNGTLAMTKDANFDPVEFAAGRPNDRTWLFAESEDDQTMAMQVPDAKMWPREVGAYDTVYITSPASTQRLCAPLITALVTSIQNAIYEQARQDALVGRADRPPVLFAIDELGLVSGWNSLPGLLADGGSNGMLLFCCMQDLAQAEKWGNAGESFPTLFGNLIVCRGLRHRGTLEALSLLVGDFDREVIGSSESRIPNPMLLGPKKEWLDNQSTQRQAKLPPSAIYAGHPHDEDAALIFTPNGGWQWVTANFYFRSGLWPILFAKSAQMALESHQLLMRGLPLPELARNGDTRFLDQIGPWAGRNWLAVIASYEHKLAKARATEARVAEEKARRDEEELQKIMDDLAAEAEAEDDE